MEVTPRTRVVQIALITAVAILGDAMLFIVLPLYYQQFGLTALWQIGLLLSVNRLIRLPINPFVAWFYKHYSLRTGLLIATILASVTTFSYGVVTDFWILLIARMLWGVAWSFLRMGAFLTIIEVSTDADRGNHVGLYNGLWGIGGLIGMLSGGFLADQLVITYMTTVFALLAVACLPMIWKAVPHASTTKEQRKEVSSKKLKFTTHLIMVLLTSLCMGFIIMGLFASTLSPLIEAHYFERWTIFEMVIGAATIAGVLQAARWAWDPFVAPLIGKWLDRAKYTHVVLFIPLVGGGILFMVIGLSSSFITLILLLLLFQLMSTFFTTTVDTIATETASKTDRVRLMMWHTIMVDVGAAIGPLISYLMLTTVEGSISFVYLCAGLMLLLFAIMWFIHHIKITRKMKNAYSYEF